MNKYSFVYRVPHFEQFDEFAPRVPCPMLRLSLQAETKKAAIGDAMIWIAEFYKRLPAFLIERMQKSLEVEYCMRAGSEWENGIKVIKERYSVKLPNGRRGYIDSSGPHAGASQHDADAQIVRRYIVKYGYEAVAEMLLNKNRIATAADYATERPAGIPRNRVAVREFCRRHGPSVSVYKSRAEADRACREYATEKLKEQKDHFQRDPKAAHSVRISGTLIDGDNLTLSSHNGSTVYYTAEVLA